MGKQEIKSPVVGNDNPTVDINTENWTENERSQFNNLVDGLIPSAEFDEGCVSIPKNVLYTRVRLGDVLETFLQLEGTNGELFFPGIKPTLQQLRETLEGINLDSIKTVFEHVEGLNDVFLDPQNLEILSTIFAQGPVVKICENINRLYGETGGNDNEKKCILDLKTNFPKVTNEFSGLESFEYNLRAKVKIPGGINKDDERILSDTYTTLFKSITKSLNKQIKEGLRRKIDGCKIDEIDAILPSLGLDYNGITIHTKHYDSPFGIVIPVQKKDNTLTVEEIRITGEDKNNDYASVIKDRIKFLKEIANLSD